jgi:hypothetical protein
MLICRCIARVPYSNSPKILVPLQAISALAHALHRERHVLDKRRRQVAQPPLTTAFRVLRREQLPAAPIVAGRRRYYDVEVIHLRGASGIFQSVAIEGRPDAAGVRPPTGHAAAPTARRRSTGNSGDPPPPSPPPPPPPPSPPSPSASSSPSPSAPRTIDRAGRHVVGRPRRGIDRPRKSARRGEQGSISGAKARRPSSGGSRPPPPPAGDGEHLLVEFVLVIPERCGDHPPP